MSNIKKIISVILCLAVLAGIFSTASSAFSILPESASQAEEKTEEKTDTTPETTVTVFGLFEAGPVMSRIIDAFPAILVFLTPFLMFYEIPYVVKDIFTNIGKRFAD